MTEILVHYGYFGMFLSALLAGSVLPFNSELVIGALKVAGLEPWMLLITGTLGNVLGGLFNYWIGTFGRMDWIEKYLHIKEEKIERAQRFMAGRGALMAFFAFLPIIGSAITVSLGLMRANLPITTASMTAGKFLRYAIIVFGIQFFQ
ncbi:MAG TPA: hypothetical protein DEQ27_03195 [Prevotella sp.]|nr:hypothetical protein [Prevotella sp.]